MFGFNTSETATSLTATDLTDVSTVSVSSEYSGSWILLNLAQMLDGNPSTYWLSSGNSKSWTRVVFDKTHTVIKIGFSVRPGNCTLRDQEFHRTYADKSRSVCATKNSVLITRLL